MWDLSSPTRDLHDPALPGHRVDEDLVTRVRDPTTGLKKCEPDGDQGGSEERDKQTLIT